MADDKDVAGKPTVVAVLWPDESNYARLCAISADYMPPTLAEFHTELALRAAARDLTAADFFRITFDPDELARWCRENGRPIKTEDREAYAKFLFEQALERAKEQRASRRRHH